MMTKKPKPKPKPIKKKAIRKPKESGIPRNILNKFLAKKISKEDNKKVTLKECSLVGHNRYRVDVWLKEHNEGFYCPSIWIGYSYYVQYEDEKIIDKTIYPKPRENRIF